MGGDVLFDCDLHGDAGRSGDHSTDVPPINQII
jgi:hypothetical protein